MIITSNTVTFEAADTALLSAEIQAALASHSGVSAEAALSGLVNPFLALVLDIANARNINVVATALVSASPATRAAANVKIDEAKVILGI